MIVRRKYSKIAEQQWDDIFFMHWRLNPDDLRAYIPAPFELDTFEGAAWLSVVCFVAKNSRLRKIPFPIVTEAIQTNVRTYVTMPHVRERGVYFLDIMINNRVVALGGRSLLQLPVHYAQAKREERNQLFMYESTSNRPSKLHVTFERDHEQDESSLGQFLIERYAIWNRLHHKIIKMPIVHKPWTLYKANATIHQHDIHPLINDKNPDITYAGDRKLTYLYPYETVGFYL